MKHQSLILLAALVSACAHNAKKTTDTADAPQSKPEMATYYDADYIQSIPQAAVLETAPQHVIGLLPKRNYVVVTVSNYPPAKPALDLSKFLTPPKQVDKPATKKAEESVEPVEYILYFDHDKSTLKKGEIEKLKKILADTPKTAKISITSHTDQDGSDKYNQKLSEKRSNSVKSKFATAGFNNIETHAMGEKQLIDPANTKKAKAKNRRSEIEVTE